MFQHTVRSSPGMTETGRRQRKVFCQQVGTPATPPIYLSSNLVGGGDTLSGSNREDSYPLGSLEFSCLLSFTSCFVSDQAESASSTMIGSDVRSRMLCIPVSALRSCCV